MGQVHDGDDRRAGCKDFALASGKDVDLATDRSEYLGVADLDFGLVGKCAGVLNLASG